MRMHSRTEAPCMAGASRQPASPRSGLAVGCRFGAAIFLAAMLVVAALGLWRFDATLRAAGYLAMGGQIVDATIVAAPKQRNTEDEKAAIKAGKSARQIWRGKPNKAHQKDVDARWTVKIGGKVRYRPDGTPLPQIATPVFGYKSHISIDRRFGFIRKAAVTSAADSDGRQMRWVIEVVPPSWTVWRLS